MRNRAGIVKEREDAFINGGSAELKQPIPEPKPVPESAKKVKARPVSISFTDSNLEAIDTHLRNEIMSGNARVNRSDIVRAAILSLENLSSDEISKLIASAKLQ